MSWIRYSVLTICLSLVTIIVIDSFGYMFRDKLAIILPNYGVAIEDFSRGYPVGHFQNDNEIGFDITPDFLTSTSTKPSEYERYEVWGNAYGCFDDKWSKDAITGGIYLAGDSFTWGYNKFDKKFGTLLEEALGTKVYACGVTHTGQGHQFHKFKRLYENGLKPSVVVVNVVSNDLDNDYFFPHTAIIDGVMVENVERCGDFESSDFRYKKLAYEDVVNLVSERKNQRPSLKSLLRQYSLTGNVVAEVTRSIRYKISLLIDETTHFQQQSSCIRSVHAGLSAIGSKYPHSEYTEKNRRFISDWIAHAKMHNYDLIFSFIPSKDITRDSSYKFIKKFIVEKGGIAHRFDDFCDSECRRDNEVYFQTDGHFNESGNELYAQFLKGLVEVKYP